MYQLTRRLGVEPTHVQGEQGTVSVSKVVHVLQLVTLRHSQQRLDATRISYISKASTQALDLPMCAIVGEVCGRYIVE